jgi:hypothetical protein
MVLQPPKSTEEVHLKVLDLFLSSNREEQCQIDVHEQMFLLLGFDLVDRNSGHYAAYL